ncbi:hypothetical protein [Hymenobacter lapidiphilus]|uniref:Uncharacterized protein n=1 Tax=Hymenobacter lapidiphilus TaxID=2608003 RepID=A0A7Y7U6T1_9BACT|nr:hypothetical protein [Hymenobacter lapidiphilus]NVO32848.1 hypothetical protein [Hymenobacter lapidiphilus]
MSQRMLPTLLVLGLAGLSSCSSPNSEKKVPERVRPITRQRQLVQVKGTFVSFGIQTFMRISCSAFEKQFSKARPFTIQDTARLQAIARRLAALQPDTAHLGVDARAKAVLFYSDRTHDTLCMDQFISVYRGRNLMADTLLYQLLGVRPKE